MLEVLYEDNHIIAINKKSGDIVQGDKTGDAPLSDFVKAYIKKKYNKPGEVFLGTIHRLDRPTSGIVLYARTSKALTRMNEQFREKQVQKTYWAVVDNAPANDSGTLENYLLKNQKQNKSYVTKTEDGKHAVLDFKLLKKLDNFFHLEIKPKTGRHHQIRVQLAHIGCIIKGDLKYGAKRSNKDASIHLLAQKLEFLHPVKKEPLIIVAPAPKDSIWEACK
jgi:23S rRNA pseudouridine1911/1915/1917 synthase|tara:strand:+ start:343 stop:1005 length:663 start_codon:yes stop_codon:yes gene_type:complete